MLNSWYNTKDKGYHKAQRNKNTSSTHNEWFKKWNVFGIAFKACIQLLVVGTFQLCQ